MIQSKNDLKLYLQQDMKFYHAYSRRDRFLCWLTCDPAYEIARYVRLLRKEEYYHNCVKGIFGTIGYLWFFRAKNRLGNRIGFKIPKNTFGPGLTIYHHGEIIVNENARIGANAKLHGGNCIGNNGKVDAAPVIGNDLNLGIGAKIIGDICLGNGVSVGANAVVTKSCSRDGATLVGIPARMLEK